MDDQSKDFLLQLGTKIDAIKDTTTDVRLVLAIQEITNKQHTDILDRLATTTANLQIISALQETNLKLHMQRTALNEQKLEAFDTEVRPILEGMRFLKRLGVLAGGIATVVGVIIKLLGK